VPDIRQLLSDLTLVGQAGCSNVADIAHLRQLLQRDAVSQMVRTQVQQRKDLYQYTLNRMASAEENAVAESAWHIQMTALGGNQVQVLLLQALLALENAQRVQRYRNADEVMRTIHIQMRTNAALVDGDWALADRVLAQYLTQATPTAASSPLNGINASAAA
jgi:hypothetical protein